MQDSKRIVRIWFGKMMLLVLALVAGLGALVAVPPAAWAEAPPTYTGQWSTVNGNWDDYNGPFAIATDNAGHVYVTDVTHIDYESSVARYQNFDAWGNLSLGRWISPLALPLAIAVNSHGYIYIGDSYYGLRKYDAMGNLVLAYPYGTGDSQIVRPNALAVDDADNVYVGDASSIKKFDAHDQFLTKIGSQGSGDGQFFSVTGLAVDSSGNIYAADGSRIQKFAANGAFLIKWGSPGSDPGQFKSAWGVAVSKSDKVYVVEAGNHRIQKFDAQGNFLCGWGLYGSGNGEFKEPRGVALGYFGKIYVSDRLNQRVQVFQINLQADAGPVQTVEEGALVTLNGANSTPQSEIATYQWEQININGTPVTLTNPASPQPTFNAPAMGPATLEFRLTVTSYDGVTSQATCIVNVAHENRPPTAEAGETQTVDEGTLVTLYGSGTDPESGVLRYSWTQVGEPAVALTNADTATPSFTAPAVGPGGSVALTFKLTVTDDQDAQATDTGIVNVSHVNRPPTANAGGGQTVNGGETVNLNGSGTDPEEALLFFHWTQKSGPPVTLSNSESANPTFTAPNVTRDEDLIFELTVSDGSLQATDSCTVTVRFVNTPPVVDAGSNVTIFTNEKDATVVRGTASDTDMWQTLNYRWLEGANPLCGWLPMVDGQAPLVLSAVSLGVGAHTLTLEVNDGCVTSTDTMELAIGNSPPTVAATGVGTYEVGSPVVLGGSISDYDGGEISYEWLEGAAVLTRGSVQAAPGGTPVSLPNFTVATLPLGVHNLTLKVSDGDNSVSGTISVSIQDTGKPTLTPQADKNILWPPNKLLVPVTILANAADNSGQAPTLGAVVSCNELLGPGVVDWTEPVIDQNAGIITLNLRADRFGKGKGRVYTVTITATDAGGNASTANVTVSVPHDQGKK